MKLHIIIIFVFTCIRLNTGLNAQVFSNADLKITKLEDKLWVVETTDKTTMYIIEGSKKAMLIDTGTNCEKLDEVVHRITQKPLYVVITHMHLDHAGNITPFKDIYFHPADTLLMKRLKPFYGKVHYVNDGDLFDLGDKTIEVKHMPGHTPGAIVLIDRSAGNCFTGDAFGSGLVWLQLWPFSPIKTYIRSCDKMEKLMSNGINNIYCGHYPYLKKALSIDYIRNMKKLAEAIDNGSAPSPHPYEIHYLDISGPNPTITSLNGVSIVYEPSKIK
ncbi:MBL fold metallo-hydrolase [Parabacteroides sp. FAFU027]|uniref:MBL fold metallo-hydrolase n=1 Tax=Parabacteroides sp. FAFU027 TaxID=2922715 RepID=UPI001FAFFDA0|nr:MBL fold metallo-hydrolase [Parabacteroides sp. FAFU027]